MELQIQDLVTSIRKEGIEAANAEAESIVAEAKKKAEAIIGDAKAEAKQIKEASEKEIAILKESAAVSAEQAKRDAVLSFKTEIQGEFEKILAADIRKELSDLLDTFSDTVIPCILTLGCLIAFLKAVIYIVREVKLNRRRLSACHIERKIKRLALLIAFIQLCSLVQELFFCHLTVTLHDRPTFLKMNF